MSQTDRQLAGLGEEIPKVRIRMVENDALRIRNGHVLNKPRLVPPKHQPGNLAERYSSFGNNRLAEFGKEVQNSLCYSIWERIHLRIYWVIKRGIDLMVALATLVVLSPILVIIAAVIKLSDGGSVLFRQERVGQFGKRFVCLKFRSMVCDADGALKDYLATNPEAREEWNERQKLEKDPRITRLGSFLRKSSLDELPQLLNIISGDMSLVGPRPITPAELDRYGERVGYYLSVKPGLTGLWQISGRSNCTYAERVDLDVSYAAKYSLALDFLIMLKTVPAVISRRGSY